MTDKCIIYKKMSYVSQTVIKPLSESKKRLYFDLGIFNTNG